MRRPSTNRAILLAAGLALPTAGCGSRSDDTSASSECGDIDGPNGEIPNILGSWTSTFGNQVFDENCGIEGLKHDDFSWLNGGAFEIEGRVPDMLYIDMEEDERFWGLENDAGGVVFTGTHEDEGHDLVTTVGGMLFTNGYLDRDQITGFVYINIDSSGDGNY
ncbi:MAG: hypothetical protein QGG40_09970, partial [Myxococcota bacterium]|nr:hypothetical protein [Myxococcota bacterium]